MNTFKLILFFTLNCQVILFGSKVVTVAKDHSGQFTSIQKALESFDKKDTTEKVIYIKNGIYEEKIFIDFDHVKLVGESKPSFGKSWNEIQKKLQKRVDGVYIIFAISRDIFRCENDNDWGASVINIKGNDIILQNITAVNTYGFDLKEPFEISCRGETKTVRKDGHQFALRTMPPTQRLTVDRCNFYSFGGDTVSPWDVENGTYTFTNCTMEGGVDFYCPRGWAYADRCYFICHNKNAAIWHDGREYMDSKSVIKNSEFIGDDGYKLGRYHRDAQLYLINCTFSENMADAKIYNVKGDNNLRWGERIYYYNCKKKGGTYDWYKNNITKDEAKVLTRENVLMDRWYHPVQYLKSHEYPIPGNDKLSTKLKIDLAADNMLIAQRNCGGWAKTLDNKTQPPPYHETWDYATVNKVTSEKVLDDCTIDNGATTREIRYLLKTYGLTMNEAYLKSAETGIRYLLEMQYEDGGFPQFYPYNKGYVTQITYNDDAMINALKVLRDVARGQEEFSTVSENLRSESKNAVEKGVSCILKTQLYHDGKLTAWAAQYDKDSYLPAKARSYEHPSYASKESVEIIKFLMDSEVINDTIKHAIQAGIAFLHEVAIHHQGYRKTYNKQEHRFDDVELFDDVEAKPIWARFYDLNTFKPIFSGRDGVIKDDIMSIDEERRRGYGWYGYWPEDLLEKEYPQWYATHFPPILTGLTKIPDTSYNLTKVLRDDQKVDPKARLAQVSELGISTKEVMFGSEGLRMDITAKNDGSSKIPIVIIHGGGWRSGDKAMMRQMANALAQRGYICFTPNYRLSTEALYPAPIQDIRESLSFIYKNSNEYPMDLNKLTILGHSAGGQLAALIANTQDKTKFHGEKIGNKNLPQIKLLIDLDGVLSFYAPESEEGDDSKRLSASTLWFGAGKWDRFDLFKEASALSHISENSPPTLFLASKEKRMRAGYKEYEAKYKSLGKYFEFFEFENAPHNFIYCEPWFSPMINKIDEFIKKH
ncbi:MAG: pectate lyase [Lewinellaceae bacterium]|nr:pectate lyase [Lewinellaceae bacterium]